MKLKKFTLFLIIALFFNINFKINSSETICKYLINTMPTAQKKDLCIYASIATGAICTIPLLKYCYNTLKKYIDAYIESKTIKESADAIVLALTTNFSINMSFLTPAQKEEKFRKKAQLINLRKRILIKVENEIERQKSLKTKTFDKMSSNHLTNVQEQFKTIKGAFDAIDSFRDSFCFKNQYEQEYTQPDWSEKIIEDKIFKSFLLSLKPDIECNKDELELKEKNNKMKNLIYAQVQSQISSMWLHRLSTVIFLFV